MEGTRNAQQGEMGIDGQKEIKHWIFCPNTNQQSNVALV